MASVYLLYSKKLDRFYRGSCLDLEERILQHQTKAFGDSFTAKADDWELYFSIGGLSYDCARRIEAHLKNMRNRKYYADLRRYPELVEALKARFG